jgi:hypothetical protein
MTSLSQTKIIGKQLINFFYSKIKLVVIEY